MAIKWGSIIKSGSSELRVGIDLVATSTTASSVTYSAKFYVWTKYRISDSTNTWTIAGDFGSANRSIDINTPSSSGTGWSTSNRMLVDERTTTVTREYGQTGSVVASCSLTGVEAVGSSNKATVSDSLTVPARAYTTPAAPSGAAHVRVSDIKNTVSWTNNETTGAPYTNVYIERSINGGAFVQIGKLYGSSTSYGDTGTAFNNYYRYRVRAENSAGKSAYSAATATTYNTPNAPFGLSAELISAGTVRLEWSSSANTANRTDIERRVDSGTFVHITWTTDTSWTDNDVPSGKVEYRVRHRRTIDGVNDLMSGYSAISNSVMAAAPPLAPTLKSVPSIIRVGSGTVRFAWTYNSADGSSQKKYEAVIAGTTYTLSSSAKYVDVPISALGLGAQQWRVRTWGTHATAGAWSAYQSFTVVAAPEISITSPAVDGEAITGLPLNINWSYSDPSGTQVAMSFQIIDTRYNRVMYAVNRSYVVQYTQVLTSQFVPENGVEYLLKLQVRSSSSLMATAERSFTVAYVAPPTPLLYVDFDDTNKSAAIRVHAGIVQGDQPYTSYMNLYRVVGEDTYLIASNLSHRESVIDNVPPIGLDFSYKVIAFAVTGAAAEATSRIYQTTGKSFIFNHGSNYEEHAELLYDLAYSDEYPSQAELVHFEGRRYPSSFSSEARHQESSISGTIIDTECLECWRKLALWGKRAYFRSPSGAAYPCTVEVGITHHGFANKKASVQVKIVRLDDVLAE